MAVPHHTHSGEESGPKLNLDDCLAAGRFNEAMGDKLVDPMRAGDSYAGFCFAEPVSVWAPMVQFVAHFGDILEFTADESYAGLCFTTH